MRAVISGSKIGTMCGRREGQAQDLSDVSCSSRCGVPARPSTRAMMMTTTPGGECLHTDARGAVGGDTQFMPLRSDLAVDPEPGHVHQRDQAEAVEAHEGAGHRLEVRCRRARGLGELLASGLFRRP